MKDFYRPLRITHGHFGYRDEDSFGDKVAKIERRVRDLKEKGFGGIVTNVGDHNYLRDETEWKLMREKERICRENGMRMWLYDEKGYPSGGAWKETVGADPDYEARGLVVVHKVLGPGDVNVFELPYGHEKTLGVIGCLFDGETVTDEELDKEPVDFGSGDRVTVRNGSNSKMLAMGFYMKHAYEGAHCMNNVCAQRRYIDVSNPRAVAEFINNTYRRYAENLGDHFAAEIGDKSEGATVEAIFTDEPSYMGHYINQGIHTPVTDHTPDPRIPLYPVINWGKNVESEFRKKYGYEVRSILRYLFLGSSDRARKARLDFYSLMSDLFENSFFRQISEYCESVGLQFSGHVLLEDELKLHVRFEGNIMRFLSHMHAPGIDMLQSVPETVRNFAFTPLLARSAAELYGRKHVMDEVSAHAQGGNVTEEQVECSLMLQLVLGCDVFTSYYDDRRYSPEFWEKLNEKIAAAAKVLEDRNLGDTIIYYPVDTVMCLQKPGVPFDSGNGEQRLIDSCQRNLESAMDFYLDGLVPFIFADPDGINEALSRRPSTLIVPGCIVTEKTAAYIERMSSEANAKVIFHDPEGAFRDQYSKASAMGASVNEPLPRDNGQYPVCGARGVVAAYGRDGAGRLTAVAVNATAAPQELRGRRWPARTLPPYGFAVIEAVEAEPETQA